MNMVATYSFKDGKKVVIADLRSISAARKYAIDNLKFSKAPKGNNSYAIYKNDEYVTGITLDRNTGLFYQSGYPNYTNRYVIDPSTGALTDWALGDSYDRRIVYSRKTGKAVKINGKLMVRPMARYKLAKYDKASRSYYDEKIAEIPVGLYPSFTNSKECFDFYFSWASTGSKVFDPNTGITLATKYIDRNGNGRLRWRN